MKIARFFAAIFGILGALVMVVSLALCLISLDAQPYMASVPQGAADCVEELMQAVGNGDLAGASARLYGQTDLGAHREPTDLAGTMIWQAHLDNISWEYAGKLYVTEAGLARDVVITTLDIGSVTSAIAPKAHAIMTQKVAQATDLEELYDENNDFRQELVDAVLQEAVLRALAEDAGTVTWQVTLKLIQADGRWYVAPEEDLLTALSGGLM